MPKGREDWPQERSTRNGTAMDLDEFVRQCEEAWQVFVTGDPGPAMRLFSRRDNVTLANPWGPAATGWPEVSSTLEAAAGRFRSGHVSAFDVRSEFVPKISHGATRSNEARRCSVADPSLRTSPFG